MVVSLCVVFWLDAGAGANEIYVYKEYHALYNLSLAPVIKSRVHAVLTQSNVADDGVIVHQASVVRSEGYNAHTDATKQYVSIRHIVLLVGQVNLSYLIADKAWTGCLLC